MPGLQSKVLSVLPQLTDHQIYTQAIQNAMDGNTSASPDNIRSLAKMVLMDCLSRRVTSEFFEIIMNDIEELLTEVRSLECGIRVGTVLLNAEPGRIPTVLDATLVKLVTKINDLRTKIAKNVGLMAQCRDPIISSDKTVS